MWNKFTEDFQLSKSRTDRGTKYRQHTKIFYIGFDNNYCPKFAGHSDMINTVKESNIL